MHARPLQLDYMRFHGNMAAAANMVLQAVLATMVTTLAHAADDSCQERVNIQLGHQYTASPSFFLMPLYALNVYARSTTVSRLTLLSRAMTLPWPVRHRQQASFFFLCCRAPWYLAWWCEGRPVVAGRKRGNTMGDHSMTWQLSKTQHRLPMSDPQHHWLTRKVCINCNGKLPCTGTAQDRCRSNPNCAALGLPPLLQTASWDEIRHSNGVPTDQCQG